MAEGAILEYTVEAISIMMLLSLLPIVIATLIGLLVSLFQALTQIQEQTLSFTVKLVAVIMTLIFLGGFLSAQIMQFANTIFQNFPKWR